MKTLELYRPVGLTEMELIAESNFKSFPPRLVWQPIFYPVLNQTYAEQIANEWNTADEFSGFCGIVTAFKMDTEYINKYEIKNVGGSLHNELWIPSNELLDFNLNIIGDIKVVNVFFGNNFSNSKNELLNNILSTFKTFTK
jgi:hypothetical protein